MQNKSFFSIVIPALNEEKYLPKLLADLSSQSFFKDKYEIIIADGNSEDKTQEIAKKFSKKINLQIFNVKKRNVAYQRNFGARKAKGEWILFMDADNRLPNFFLDGIKYQISKNKNVDVFTCHLNTSTYTGKEKQLFNLVNVALDFFSKIQPFAAGSLIGIKNQKFRDASFDINQRMNEDIDFVSKCAKNGMLFLVFAEPKYTYSLRRFKKEGSLRMLRKYSQALASYFTSEKLVSLPEYPMIGGKYYELENDRIIGRLISRISNMSKKQFTEMRKILKNI